MDNIKTNREALEIVARSSALDLYKLGRVHAEYEIIEAFVLSDTCPYNIKCEGMCRNCWEEALRNARKYREKHEDA